MLTVLENKKPTELELAFGLSDSEKSDAEKKQAEIELEKAGKTDISNEKSEKKENLESDELRKAFGLNDSDFENEKKSEQTQQTEQAQQGLHDDDVWDLSDFLKSQAEELIKEFGLEDEYEVKADEVFDTNKFKKFQKALIDRKALDVAEQYYQKISDADERAATIIKAVSENSSKEMLDKLFTLYQNQSEFVMLPTETEDEKTKFLEEYYTKIKGENLSFIRDDIKQWKISGRFDARFEKALQESKDYFQKQESKILLEEKKLQEQKIEETKKRQEKYRDVLLSSNTLDKNLKSEIFKKVFTPLTKDVKLSEAHQVLFDLEKSNPELFISILHFALNKDSFINNLTQTTVEKTNRTRIFTGGSNAKSVTEKVEIKGKTQNEPPRQNNNRRSSNVWNDVLN